MAHAVDLGHLVGQPREEGEILPQHSVVAGDDVIEQVPERGVGEDPVLRHLARGGGHNLGGHRVDGDSVLAAGLGERPAAPAAEVDPVALEDLDAAGVVGRDVRDQGVGHNLQGCSSVGTMVPPEGRYGAGENETQVHLRTRAPLPV